MTDDASTLFRPVGLRELELIAESGFRGFPPRLPEQPIFYPVLELGYARQIARDWNTKDRASGYCGFVTEFDLPCAYLARYPVQTVGGPRHTELWVPAEELPELNSKIRGTIRVVESFYGADFEGDTDPESGLPASVVRDADGG